MHACVCDASGDIKTELFKARHRPAGLVQSSQSTPSSLETRPETARTGLFLGPTVQAHWNTWRRSSRWLSKMTWLWLRNNKICGSLSTSGRLPWKFHGGALGLGLADTGSRSRSIWQNILSAGRSESALHEHMWQSYDKEYVTSCCQPSIHLQRCNFSYGTCYVHMLYSNLTNYVVHYG